MPPPTSPLPIRTPTILLLPGSFAPTAYYFPLQSHLWRHNYPTIRLPLPSIIENTTSSLSDDATTPSSFATFEDDVAVVRTQLTTLIDHDHKDVVVVTHSYSGAVGTEACKGFTKAEREAEGKEGGVRNIVYIASGMQAVGKAPEGLDLGTLPGYVKFEHDGAVMALEPAGLAPYLFNDLPPTEALFWAEGMARHSSVSFNNVLTFPAWRFVDAAYVLLERDGIVPVEVQKATIAMMDKDLADAEADDGEGKGGEGKKVGVFARALGHAANFTHVEWVGSVIRRVCGEYV